MDTPNVHERSLGRALGKRTLVYIGILVLIFALVLVLNTSNASAAGPTSVSGPIAANTNWNATGSPYIVTGDITVNAGVTLTIWPNTTVAFDAGQGINVLGTLNVLSNGTLVNNVVTFTSNQPPGFQFPGQWTGIVFAAGSSGSFSNARLNYATDPIVNNGGTVTFAGLTTIANSAGNALTYTWATGNHSVALSNLAITNANNGVSLISAPGANVALTLTNSVMLDITTFGVTMSGDNCSLTVTGGTFQNTVPTPGPMIAGVALTSLYSSSVTMNNVQMINVGEGVYAISTNGDTSVSLTNVRMTNTVSYGVFAISSVGSATINAVDSLFNHSAGSFAFYVVANRTVTATISGSTVNDTAIGALIQSLVGRISVSLTGTTMQSSSQGLYLIAPAGGVSLTMSDSTITSPYAIYVNGGGAMTFSLTGVTINGDSSGPALWADSPVAGAGSLVLTNVTIMNSVSGVNFVVNGSATLTVNNLLMSGVNVTTSTYCVNVQAAGDIVANINSATFIGGWGDGFHLVAGGALTLTANDVKKDNSQQEPVWATSGIIYAWGMTNVDVQVTNLVGIQVLNGLNVGSSTGDATVVVNGGSMMPQTNASLFGWTFAFDGIVVDAPLGAATVTVNDFILDAIDTLGAQSGLSVVANKSIEVSVTNSQFWLRNDGIYVWTDNGSIVANLNGVTIAQPITSGISFYAPMGAIDLMATDVTVLGDNSPAGIVAQCALDLTANFVRLSVDNAENGVLLLSTDGNVVLTVTDAAISACDIHGMEVVAANGWITAAVDPSNYSGNWIGLYLDSATTLDVWINDTLFENNVWGIEAHAADAANFWLNNVSFNGNMEGLYADSDNANLMLDVQASSSMDSYYVFELWAFTQDINLNIVNGTFNLGHIAVLAHAERDINSNVVNTKFLGQDGTGLSLAAGHDIVSNVSVSNFDGSSAKDATLFLPTPIEDLYTILDPGVNWTIDSTMNVPLPWTFEFNGVGYNFVNMSMNGWIAFGSAADTDIHFFGPSSPNMIVAAQYPWTSDAYPGMGYKVLPEQNAIVFQWYVWDAGQAQLKNVFEIWLFTDGAIQIRYGPMEAYGLPTYDYGINVNGFGGLDWNLKLWSPDVFSNDWKSVAFAPELMSFGKAMFLEALGNVTQTLEHSAVSHYMAGGMIVISQTGWSKVTVDSNTFAWIGPMDGWAAVYVQSMSNVIDVSMTNNSFTFVSGWAVWLQDGPMMGGVSSMVLDNSNSFSQVVFTAALVTEISSPSLTGAYSLTTTKTIDNVAAANVGPVAMLTMIDTPQATWTLVSYDNAHNNSLSGNVDPWLVVHYQFTPMMFDVVPAMIISSQELLGSNGTSSTQHWVSITDNMIVDAPWAMDGPAFAVISVNDMWDGFGNANIASVQMLDITNNVVTAPNVPFAAGAWINAVQTLDDPIEGAGLNLDSTLMFEQNSIQQGFYGPSAGLWYSISQNASYGQGNAALKLTATVTDNVISGFNDGVHVSGVSEIYNEWGSTTSDIVLLVENNQISAGNDAVFGYFWTSAKFSHYFPPYEQVVSGTAAMNFAVDVSSNILSAGADGVDIETSGRSQANYFGVFTLTSVTLTGYVTANDNTINVIYADNGILAGSDLRAIVGGATASSNIAYTMLRNNITSNQYADGIYVWTDTFASTLSLRYGDMTNATTTTTVDIMNNNIVAPWDGVNVFQYAYAILGSSVATLNTTVTEQFNTVTMAEDEGLYTDIAGTSDSSEGPSMASVMATVVVTQNTVQGDGFDLDCYAIDVEVYAWNYFSIFLNDVNLAGSTILIDNNTVSEAYVGIYTYTWPVASVQSTITNNRVDSCGYGIEVDDGYFVIMDNFVTNAAYEGIEIYYGTGLIENNIISGMAGMSAEGITFYDDWEYYFEYDLVPYNVIVRDNTLSDLGGDGIYIEDSYYLTIVQNTFTNIGGDGIYADGTVDEFNDLLSAGLMIEQNTFTGIAGDGIDITGINGLTVQDNTMDGVGGYGIIVSGVEIYDGEEDYYYVDSTGIQIMGNTLSNVKGGIALVYCFGGMVDDNVLSSGPVEANDGGEELTQAMVPVGVGVFIAYSGSITVQATTITGFDNGVWVMYSSDIIFNEVEQSMAASNGGQFDSIEGLTISSCMFNDNHFAGLILSYVFDAVVSDTAVNNNGMDGLVIYSGSNIQVKNGQFINNGLYGLLALTPIDWIVDARCVVSNNWVEFLGDLTVRSGGTIVLSVVDFDLLGDTRDGLAVISVENGGAMLASNVDFYFSGDESGSGYYYEFNVLGTLDFLNVLEEDALELYLGPTSQATIASSTIVYNLRNGIHVRGSAPVILSSIIASNPRNGIFLEGAEAAPTIFDCIIADNERGLFAIGANLGNVTDNVFAINSLAGVFVTNVNGEIRDNIFLLNGKEIFVVGSTVTIQDNEIGYSKIIDVIAQFAPLLGLLNTGGSGTLVLGDVNLDVSSAMLSTLLLGHVGVYAVDSTVTTMDNDFGMLTTGIMLVNSTLTFNDNIASRFITIPYMCNCIIRNMSLPVPVYDGIVATRNSNVVVNGGTINVMDDAIGLMDSTATISNANLIAGDFSLYLSDGSTATMTNTIFGKVSVDGNSSLTVASALTVVVKDPWGNTLANVPVGVKNATGVVKAQGRTDANGVFVVNVVSYEQTSSGKNYGMHPYTVNASFGGVDTSGYPGDKAEFSPAEVSKSLAVPMPTTVVIQTNVIVWYNLTIVAAYPNGDPVSGAHVALMSADGQSYTGVTQEDGKSTTLVISYIQTPTGADTSMQPYTATVLFPEHGSQPGASRVDFAPNPVSMSVTVDKTTTQVVKTGIIVYHALVVTAKDNNNNSVADVFIIVKNSLGQLAASGPTGADGTVSFDVIAYILAANGTKDISMNPYMIESRWGGDQTGVPVNVDLSGTAGAVQVTVIKFIPDQTLTIALVTIAVAALLLGIALWLVARRD